MDKMKMRLMAMSGKSKEMPFGKEAIDKVRAKKQGDGMDHMLSSLMGEDKPDLEIKIGDEQEGAGDMAELGELSPEEKMLIMAFRKKKAVV